MPLYNFKNKETGETLTEIMSYKVLDQYLVDNPHLQQMLSTPGFADPHRMGRIKPDDNFRDLLKETKKAHLGSTINTF
ncbi:MAG TPA: hypothetical protein DCX27_03550 [Balneola sp.]|nr:hypothetical protein [Balneola sp.]|tara:strand:- start:1789 stop:2022 length:234 start_codon:yes stop_codon:yes gene_type:complete